jgi:TonB family protein
MSVLAAPTRGPLLPDELPGAHVNAELDAIRRRTRETVLFAILLHLLLFLFLSLVQALTPEPVELTEITWLEPEVEAPVPVPEAPKPVPVKPQLAVKPTPDPARFERKREVAEQSLTPQRDVSRDLLQERIAALQQNREATPSPALVAASELKTPAPSISAPPTTSPTRTATLTRGNDAPKPTPIELRREPTRTTPTMAQVAPRPTREPEMPKIASASRRDMAGMTLVGPVADRRILTYKSPVYPDWAKRDAVEASVRLYFIVLPGGEVKENVLVQKTGGYQDFDDNAVAAIRQWRFEPLPGSGEQWGEITFNYRLSRGSGE